jgi:hypothetical protein
VLIFFSQQKCDLVLSKSVDKLSIVELNVAVLKDYPVCVG